MNPKAYKACEGCDTHIPASRPVCQHCGAYRFRPAEAVTQDDDPRWLDRLAAGSGNLLEYAEKLIAVVEGKKP